MATPFANTEIDFPAFDGETYGVSHSFNEITGNFRRSIRGKIQVMEGPDLVAEHLVRVLKTPEGDDPIRPEFGLDRKKLLGTTLGEAKQAIIEAIGPGHIPWVARLGLGDIDIETIPPENPDVKDSRNVRIHIRARLADGTVSEFAVGYDSLLRSGRSRTYPARPSDPNAGTPPTYLYGEAYRDSYEYGPAVLGFGYEFGYNFGAGGEVGGLIPSYELTEQTVSGQTALAGGTDAERTIAERDSGEDDGGS